ncbi:ABC transporter substrate-binding protein [Roseofilum sp. Guam]|uniref:ABC transporter substrate-binding protein n=1 Tax=Roseofilum sp. Guam TaxID=2821502 RepID=UPI001B2CE59E|nr:ABC transporter substrate-binding protein [Roseofilum sp. Guam]MBP0028239.1 ABC transporter substrate-binding protein [Roseofilum sp. Guam]
MLKSYPDKASAKPGFLFLQGILFFFIFTFVLPGCQSQPEEPIAQESATTHSDGTGIVTGDTSDMKIALSMSFLDRSTYRTTSVEAFEKAARQAKKQGLLAEYVVLDAERSTEKQIKQVQQLVDEGYNAIVMEAASVTALNPAVRSACEAGVIIIGAGNTLSEPCAYNITNVWNDYGALQATYLGNRLKQGNLLEVRGLKGASADSDISASLRAGLMTFPDLNIVASVYGSWTQEIAREEVEKVLPSLPSIDAVVTQGGDGYGVAQAFAATDRPLPIILMGNRYKELKWWQEQRDANGYQTVSAAGTPGATGAAVWIAQQISAGKEVPKFLELPLLIVDETTLDAWLAVTPENRVADAEYTLEWIVKLIDAHIAGDPLPPNPIPEMVPES